MESIRDKLHLVPKKRGSERSYWVSQIEQLLKIPRRPLIFKWLSHIPAGTEGTEILRVIYLDALKGGDREKDKQVKCWQLIKESKSSIIKVD